MARILLIIFAACIASYGQQECKPEYSRWLRDSLSYTDQTSGIAFIGRSEDSSKLFLLADDIGDIYLLRISKTESYSLSKYSFSPEVSAILDKLPKKDFEEISYDRYTGEVYLSVEGNMPFPSATVGIYKAGFKNGDIRSMVIESLSKMEFTPEETFLENVKNNIGFEGICADENYFYLGLEGFQKGKFFGDSTIIYVADKKTLEIKYAVSTKTAGIGTVCGLYAEGGGSLWVMDRNAAKIFKIKITGNRIEKQYDCQVVSNIPGSGGQGYTMALESITLDDEGYLYCVDDPWRTFYIPGPDVLNTLDASAADNFKNYIPIIYKFRIIK